MNNNPLKVTHLRFGHLASGYSPLMNRTLCWSGSENYLGVFMVDMTRAELANWLSNLSVANFISQSAFNQKAVCTDDPEWEEWEEWFTNGMEIGDVPAFPLKRLPYDAEVEYLESTDTQWIDTGVVWNRALTVSATVVGLQSTTYAIQAFFGARNLNAANAGYTFGFNSSNRFVSDNSGSRVISSMIYAHGAVYTIVKNLSGCSITNAAGTTENLINNAGTQTATYNLLLFALNNVGAPSRIKCRFYGCKIWDANGVLVRDFIPVRFTNELGQTEGAMYDRVSKTLFRNAGTGNFLMGPDRG